MKSCGLLAPCLVAVIAFGCGGSSTGTGGDDLAPGQDPGTIDTFPDPGPAKDLPDDAWSADVPEYMDTGAADDGQDHSAPGDAPGDKGYTADPDPGPPPDVPACEATVTIEEPEGQDFHVAGDPVVFSAKVEGSSPAGTMEVRWETAGGFVLGSSDVGPSDNAAFVATNIPTGHVVVKAVAFDANGDCAGKPGEVEVIVCSSIVSDDFDGGLDPAKWKVLHDAFWDAGGWIDVTGLDGDQGQIYDENDYVTAGSVLVRLRFATGGGSTPGGDGLAMTIIEAKNAVEFEQLVNLAGGGGGLGYSVGGAYGSFTGSAMTVEIDTWHNVEKPDVGELHTDPVPGDHLAITLGADAGNHVVWYELSNIQDLAWHDVEVEIDGTDVRVTLDGAEAIHQDVPSMDFRGGYIFFSGAAGWAYNHHRFDDLWIVHGCN